jgi:hypothetical protein
VTHLAFLHQLGHAADRLLDRNVRVDPVLVKQIDRLQPQALERAFARAPRIRRRAVQTGHLVPIPPHREFGSDD